MALPCAGWPGSWDWRSRTRRWVFSVRRPVQGGRGHGGNLGPSLEHPEHLQPVCAPGAAAGAWRAAGPPTGGAAAGRWGLKSWGPPLRSHEAVKTTALTLLHLSGKEAGVGEAGEVIWEKLLWFERHPKDFCSLSPATRTSALFSQQHARSSHPDAVGRKGRRDHT